MFVARRDRAELGLLAAGADQQQVGVEQARLALAQPGGERLRRGVAVAQQLLERLVHRVGRVRIADLRLHHHQRDAVHEQHDVRNDAALHAARRVDAELVDGVENVALRVGEVDQLHHRVGLAGEFVHVHLGLEEQLLDRLVGFEQRAVGLAQHLVAQVVELALGQPFLAVRGAIDCADGIAEHCWQQPLAKAHPQAGGRVGRDDAVVPGRSPSSPARRAGRGTAFRRGGIQTYFLF